MFCPRIFADVCEGEAQPAFGDDSKRGRGCPLWRAASIDQHRARKGERGRLKRRELQLGRHESIDQAD